MHIPFAAWLTSTAQPGGRAAGMANSRPWTTHVKPQLSGFQCLSGMLRPYLPCPAPNTLLIFYCFGPSSLSPRNRKFGHTRAPPSPQYLPVTDAYKQGMLYIPAYNCYLHLIDFWILQPSSILYAGLSYEPWPAAQWLETHCKSGTPNY